MKRTAILIVMLCFNIISVSAWHCSEYEDDSVDGWFRIRDRGDNMPEGCEKISYFTGACADFCINDTTYRNFQCEKRFPNTENRHTVIAFEDRPDHDRCAPKFSKIPEFTIIGAAALLAQEHFEFLFKLMEKPWDIGNFL